MQPLAENIDTNWFGEENCYVCFRKFIYNPGVITRSLIDFWTESFLESS